MDLEGLGNILQCRNILQCNDTICNGVVMHLEGCSNFDLTNG